MRSVVACVLGVSCLGWIVELIGPPHGTAIVHVTESAVEVSVGGRVFVVSQPHDLSPIVCKLPPGEHELTMTRSGRELYRETFTIHRDRGTVLTAYDTARYPKATASHE
ncbi:hypothetical protein [Tautonia rosea]|uniref:hypothetical protein n=1 Tax=Tautonia rosea TaxID=2728037 RepID=UPI0014759ED3|nr:hypothetical protein [Tautonia rosea]